METRDRAPILRLFGILLLLAGVAFALLAPVEMYSFYLFSEGGPFHYEGFGFGSFMFGNIAAQIIAYYLIGFLLIPLGYGHLSLRRWARTLALTALGFWLVVGVPVAILFLLVLVSSKEPTLASVLLFLVLLALSYFAVPGLLIRFYRNRDVRATFEARDPRPCWTDHVPVPVLVLGFLCLFYAVCLHIPILFSGIFPLFGVWIFDLPGIILLALSMATLVFLTWGIIRVRIWAWWGLLVFFVTMSVSCTWTLLISSWQDILSGMRFPPTEMDILQGLPLQGYHLAAVIGLPLLLTLGLIMLAKQSFPLSSGPEERRA